MHHVVHLYKRKDNKYCCGNHRGISLLSIAGKILARVILNRVTLFLVNSVQPEAQCGFRAGRGTIDMIFALRQVQEKVREQNKHLYIFMVFIDLTKAFDFVNRVALWIVLRKFGCPDKFVSIIQSFHDGMMASVMQSGESSEPFPVANGTTQGGCVMAPVLFAIHFSAMLLTAFNGLDTGVNIQFRTDGNIFTLQRMRAQTKIKHQVLRNALFSVMTVHSQRTRLRTCACSQLSTALHTLPAALA